MKNIAILTSAIILAGCASTPPTKVSEDTYYSSKPNAGGVFGDVRAVAGALMTEGNKFCADQGKEFQLVTQESQGAIPFARLGGASITFKCVSAQPASASQ